MPSNAMDIARLLTSNESDLSDHESHVNVETSPVTVVPKVTRPRRNRRRKPSIDSLRAQVEAYEYVVANLPIVLQALDDETKNESTSTSTKIDTATERIRTFLRRTIVLTHEAQHERAQQTEYLRLLKNHVVSTMNLRKLMRGLALDDWFWTCERWRSLTREYYQPIRSSQCYRLVEECLQAIKVFPIPRATKHTSFCGWRDSARYVKDERYLHLWTRKTQPHGNIKATADHTWMMYQCGEHYKQYNLAATCQLFHQILQHISPDIMIIQIVEKYPNFSQNVHSVLMVFRVATETGYLFVVRCISAPELESIMHCEGLALGDLFYWCAWDITRRDANGECIEFETTFGGYIGSDCKEYAQWWFTECFLALIRAETSLGSFIALEANKDSNLNTSHEAEV